MAWETYRVEDVLATTRDATTGAILVQIGDIVHERVEDSDCPSFQQWGLVSRPSKATAKQSSASVVVLRSTGPDIAIAGRDLRSSEIAGQLQEGETCVYACTGQARALFKADGSITLYTTADNTKNGTSVALSLGPSGFKLFGPWGAVTVDSNNGIQLGESGGAFIKMKGGEITISATSINLTGSAVNIGANPILPAVGGPTGVAGAGSLTVKISP